MCPHRKWRIVPNLSILPSSGRQEYPPDHQPGADPCACHHGFVSLSTDDRVANRETGVGITCWRRGWLGHVGLEAIQLSLAVLIGPLLLVLVVRDVRIEQERPALLRHSLIRRVIASMPRPRCARDHSQHKPCDHDPSYGPPSSPSLCLFPSCPILRSSCVCSVAHASPPAPPLWPPQSAATARY